MEEMRRTFEHAHINAPGQLVRFEHDDGMILTGAVYGEGAFLLYQQDENDAGWSSRNPTYAGPAGAVLPLLLENGQRDDIPACWVIPLHEAIRAAEYFFSSGERAPWVCWHDDYFPQERIKWQGKVLTVLVNGERAWLRYQRNEDDPGVMASDLQDADAEEGLYEFIMNDGQCVSYPLSQTISKEEASRVRDYLFRTGEKAPWIHWRHET